MPSSKLVTGNTETKKAQFLFFRTLLFLRETNYSKVWHYDTSMSHCQGHWCLNRYLKSEQA